MSEAEFNDSHRVAPGLGCLQSHSKGKKEVSKAEARPVFQSCDTLPWGSVVWGIPVWFGWKVSPQSSLGTLKPADVYIFLSVDTTGHLDPDKVLPCRHGEGSGKFSVAVSQPDGLFFSYTCGSSSHGLLAEARVPPGLLQLPPTSGPHG